MDPDSLRKVITEINRRRKRLIELSYQDNTPIVPVERERIQSLLERWESPTRPTDVESLMKQFCVSAFSYAPLRKYLISVIGDIPMRDTIAITLSKVFNENEFLTDSNWSPTSLHGLASRIQSREKFDLSRKLFKPRIISVLLSGTKFFEGELSQDLDAFYQKITFADTPIEMWKLALEVSKSINNVGVALVCDFLKEIGFTRFVKVDHHFKREFPELLSTSKTCKQSPKESFILSQELADSIGITPFHLDSILYLWGRYGDKRNLTVHSDTIVKSIPQKMKSSDGIIDKQNNPFATPSWIEQRHPLTTERQVLLTLLFGKELSSIKNPNKEKYPAFLGIRWGFATIERGRLIQSEKWIHRFNYDDRGYPLKRSK
ncbi:MAG: hypothetical protein KA807_15350 [Prolixibacteraceae bacterium]|jgi:hypothetical protein|nr:hypothetical protein [Prolixibacteraceae bacterium]